MADWVRVAEMLKEYLTFYGDYYTLNRKVTVIDHKCADPNSDIVIDDDFNLLFDEIYE
jgi:hypothetical protein